jgi:hypothetical protein
VNQDYYSVFSLAFRASKTATGLSGHGTAKWPF